MGRFREIFCDTNRGSITCPNGADGRSVCIKFYSKWNCTHDCSRSHAYLRRQTQADYIRFLGHFRSGYKARNYKRKRKSSREGRNFRYKC